MILRQTVRAGVFSLMAAAIGVSTAHPQGAETFTATASVKTAAGASATAPVTIVVDRTMSQAEADKFLEAFKTGGGAALRKALTGVPPTGSVRLGEGSATPTRLTIERATDKGRLLSIVTDQPLFFLGAGIPGAKSKEGYDFGVVDIEVDAKGSGSGTLAGAARVTVKQGVFVVDDYSGELVRLTSVKKAK
jgi:hypothetical protein